mmetsp:Transcript_16083/g.34768  ORF Transcript_16083/g.34768 Transcript_16083/m.34768 type:complete len:249 (-) Transcript_16083:175-921(-)
MVLPIDRDAAALAMPPWEPSGFEGTSGSSSSSSFARRRNAEHFLASRLPNSFVAAASTEDPAQLLRAEKAAQQSPSEEKPLKCFNKRGKVCNKEALGDFDDPIKDKLDHRNKMLSEALNMEDPPWGGPWDGGLMGHIRIANAATASEKQNVIHKVDEYVRSMKDFEKAFDAYKKKATIWQDTIMDFEDDYAVHCRSYHDVSMKCESDWRSGLRWWKAREPLPQCIIGAVTPYKRLPVHHGLLHWLGLN